MPTTERNERTGRWFITMGTPGFNLPANNGSGYASKASAERAIARCTHRGPRFIFDRDMMGMQILRRVEG